MIVSLNRYDYMEHNHSSTQIVMAGRLKVVDNWLCAIYIIIIITKSTYIPVAITMVR